MQMGHSQKSPLKCKNSTFSPTELQTAVFARGASHTAPDKGAEEQWRAEWPLSAGPLTCCHGDPTGAY